MISVPEITEPDLTDQTIAGTVKNTDSNFNHTLNVEKMINIEPMEGPETACRNEIEDELNSRLKNRDELSLVDQLRI